MPPGTNNITLQDFNIFLYLLEGIGLVLITATVLQLLTAKKDASTTKLRNVLVVVFAVWGIAFLGQRVLTTYNYFHLYRPALQRTHRQETGL